MRFSGLQIAVVFGALLAGAAAVSLLGIPSRSIDKPYTLLVTWLVHNQPPASYQTEFASQQACANARSQILGEQERLAKNEIAENEALKAQWAGKGGIVGPPVIPQVTTVCAAHRDSNVSRLPDDSRNGNAEDAWTCTFPRWPDGTPALSRFREDDGFFVNDIGERFRIIQNDVDGTVAAAKGSCAERGPSSLGGCTIIIDKATGDSLMENANIRGRDIPDLNTPFRGSCHKE
jgi:hypothetical protein